MKTGIHLLIISSFLTFSCDIPCEEGYSEGLHWIDREIQTLEEFSGSEFLYMTKAEYKRTTVYIVRSCCANCYQVPPVYDCSGALVGHIPDDIDASNLKNEILYWQPDNFACSKLMGSLQQIPETI